MGDVIYSESQQKILIDDYTFGGGEQITRIFDYPGVSTDLYRVVAKGLLTVLGFFMQCGV